MAANGTGTAGGSPPQRDDPPAPAPTGPPSLFGCTAAAAAEPPPTANGGAAAAPEDLPGPAGGGGAAAAAAASASAAVVATAAAAAAGPPVPPTGGVDPRRAVIAGAVRTILGCLDAEPSRPGLAKTPDRVAAALLYCTAGGGTTPRGIAGDAVWAEPCAAAAAGAAAADGGDGGGGGGVGLVLVRSIRLYSICEHHLLPFFGTATVAYMPGAAGVLVGLSKLARLADAAARSLQVQERLTARVADDVASVTGAAGVAVLVDATHLCMAARGVAQGGATTVTTAWRGAFVGNAALRAEFLTLARP